MSTQGWYVYRSLFLSQHWCLHVKESERERNYFSIRAQLILIVLLGLFIRWEANGCTADFLKCYLQDFFEKARDILKWIWSSILSMHFVRNLVLFYQILNFHLIDSFTISVHVFPMHLLISLSEDGILLLRYLNWSTYFRVLQLKAWDGFFFFWTY